jgi:Cu(I)-responsive transcriptional regulator
MQEMNIGQAAEKGGVSAKMIRHYETIGLLNPARRTASGYRVYTESDVHTLRFIKQSRNLGFSMQQISNLLDLWRNQRRTSRKVKELALTHMEELDDRIRELQQIRQALDHLVNHCHGDERPDCPILEGLANGQELKNRTKSRFR